MAALLRRRPTEHHDVVATRVFQKHDVFTVAAQSHVKGIVGIDAAAAAFEAVDIWPQCADIRAVFETMDADITITVSHEKILAAREKRVGRTAAVIGVRRIRLVINRNLD